MSATWAINGTSLSALGLEFAGGSFRAGAPSTMTLRRAADMDAAPLFEWGDPVVLTRNGTAFFRGKVNSLPTGATGSSEGQDIEIVDAWADLEATTYEEEWPAGSSGTVSLPIAILGRSSTGAQITDAQQIAEAVNFAASAGVDIQMGSIPAGLPLWQSKIENQSVAEVINLSLRFHPDWIPWIDHATSPPTLNFTPRASAATRVIDIDASVDITRRDDLKPDAVKITYLNATVIDGETYRDWIEDKHPSGGPSSGPRVLSTVLELAGGQMQFQKSRIQTRNLPTDQDSAKAWLKLKFPKLKDVPDGHFNVTSWAKELLVEDEDDQPHPDPINPRAERLDVDDADDLPRELVRGSIEDWMRRKVGKVRIEFAVRATGGASGASKAAIDTITGMKAVTVTATDAVTKIYKGITSWVAAEAAPTGIAAAIYNSLSAYQFEGSITTVMEDVSGDRFHGCKLNIAGGKPEWASMEAMVHSVSFDIATGSTTISVGPAPYLSAADMLELQRLLRSRKVTWMSEQERTSVQLGATADPGSKGDTVAGYDQPETLAEYAAPPRLRFEPYIGGDDGDRLYVAPGTVTYCRLASQDREDDDGTPEAQQAAPVYPSIEDTAIDAEEPPFFDVGSKSGCALWLCTQRIRCGTSLAGESADERIEITDRGDKPERQEGELHRLIAEMDFADDDGGRKTITNLDAMIQSDVEVWYECTEDGSSAAEDSDEVDSQIDSSELSDVPNDPSDSASDADCPWQISDVDWIGKKSCYSRKGATIGFRVTLKLGSFMSRCRNWYAIVTAEGGVASVTHLDPGQSADAGGGVKVPLTRRFASFRVPFRFEPSKCKVLQNITVKLVSEPKDPPASDSSCCGDAAGSKTKSAGMWPGWCEYNGTCGTTVLPP